MHSGGRRHKTVAQQKTRSRPPRYSPVRPTFHQNRARAGAFRRPPSQNRRATENAESSTLKFANTARFSSDQNETRPGVARDAERARRRSISALGAARNQLSPFAPRKDVFFAERKQLSDQLFSRNSLLARGRRSCPLGLIGMLVTIGTVERSIAPRIYDARGVGRVEMSWEDSARAAGASEGKSEILLLGDSRIKLGLLPRVLHDQLGFSVYNLGMLGGQAPGNYFLLRRVLDRGSRPRAIVVDYSESLLRSAPGQNAACWADRFGWRDGVAVAWHSTDPALAVSAALHALLPGWCDGRDRGRLLGLGAKTATLTAAPDDRRVFERNWRQNDGVRWRRGRLCGSMKRRGRPAEPGVLIRQTPITLINYCACGKLIASAFSGSCLRRFPNAGSACAERRERLVPEVRSRAPCGIFKPDCPRRRASYLGPGFVPRRPARQS